MENTPKLSNIENSFNGIDYTEPTFSFYERPEGVNRHLTEVAPQPGETDGDFTIRANEELTEQYPSSSREDKVKMAKKILVAERQQMDSNYAQKQQEHESLADEAYRKELVEVQRIYKEDLARVQKEYQDDKKFIDEAQKRGLATDEFVLEAEPKRRKKLQDGRKESMRRWLDGRHKAFEQYDARFHERVNTSEQPPEYIEQFREREMIELNSQHEKMMNYEARRLGIADGLDRGLVLQLIDGDFKKEVTPGDLKSTIRNGLEDSDQLSKVEEAEHFVDKLWQPELEGIKHNAVMRAIAKPTQSVDRIDEEGAHHREIEFILPIHNKELTSYVAENIQGDKDTLALCAGLSDVLENVANDEAAARAADWFYDLAHKEAGLDADSVLTAVEAMSIARGNYDDRKWGARYSEFISRHWEEWDDLRQKQSAKQEQNPMEEFTINLEQLRNDLYKKCQDLIANTEFETISSVGKRSDKNSAERKKKPSSSISEILDDIVLYNRFKNHYSGVAQVIDHMSDPVFINDDGEMTISISKRIKGKWATTDCIVSALEINRPDDIGKIWAYITEGTLHHEQHYYYGLADSLDKIRDLFNGTYYRDRVPGEPNIFDEGAYARRHWVTPKKLEGKLSPDNNYDDMYILTNKNVDVEYSEIADDLLIDILVRVQDFRSKSTTPFAGEAEQSAESEKQLVEEPTSQQMSEDYQWSRADVQPTDTFAPEQPEEASSQVSDRDLFKTILSDKQILSSRGRGIIRDKYNSLRALSRTPKKAMQELGLPESDIRSLIRILVENGREPKYKWLDE
ncbi:MAG: hypothetical protein K6G49_02365 [Candidatus Saccharibacteria bacterium]|nr:hypothetical protein [Candidatus Saccharibacteria bacterium]